jgi:ABC-type multidrug transport system fused ATPase/permease subunit
MFIFLSYSVFFFFFSGRIINRFTGDMTQIDQLLLPVLLDVISSWLELLGYFKL